MRLPLIMMLLLIILSVVIDFYITRDVRSHSSKRTSRRNTWIYIGSCILCYMLLVAVLLMPKRDEEQGILPVMWLLFSYLSIYFPKFVYCIFSLLGRLIMKLSRQLVNYGAMIGLPVSVLILILMWWGVLFTRHNINVNEEIIKSEKIPAGFNNYRIVQFSDMHVGTWGNDTSFVSKVVSGINGLEPDLILFTGDIVNRKTEEIEPFIDILSRLHAKDGVYSILGNHDYGDYVSWNDSLSYKVNLARLKDIQNKMGWKLLNNDHAYIVHSGDTVVLIGVENWGEPPFKQYGDLKGSYGGGDRNNDESLYDNKYKILMTHNPEHWDREVVKNSNIDLTLSGHTHAMQMEVSLGKWKWSPSSWKYKHWGGLYGNADNDMLLYVNIGAGEVGIPMRIGATPELTVLTLKSDSKPLAK